MIHGKEHTEAIVLSSLPSDEASKFLHLLTKDFGFIVAYIRGLQDLSHARVDLIHGKGGWRVASAVHIQNFYSPCARAAETHAVIARISALLRRLLKGEEKNEMLFDDVENGFAFLSSENPAPEDARAVEVILVMRILNHLGYWGDDAVLSPFLVGSISNMEYARSVQKQKLRAILAINKALQETQL